MFEKSTMDARPDEDQATHRCIAGQSCRATIVEDGEKRPAHTEHPDTLCPGCTAHHRAASSRLLRDYAMLRVTIGEPRAHQQNGGVHSTPAPRIPIDATSDRLMTELVEWTGYAADLISAALKVTTRDGSRRLATQIRLDDENLIERFGAHTVDLEDDALAARSWETTHPTESERLTAYTQVVDQHLDILAGIPAHDVQIWAQPRRCDDHADKIADARRMLNIAREIRDHHEINEAIDTLQAAFAEAGACNECCGWSEDGRYQARQDVTMSGLDVLFRLTRTHQLIREHLGHTRIRHQYAMPCPNCGSPVGRDDGSTVVTCDNDHCTKSSGKWGPSSWTDGEYRLLSGMLADDERTRNTTRYLLAEGYARLDSVQNLVDKLQDDPVIDTAGAGRIILERLTEIIENHARPKDRKIATDKAAAEKRQETEDNWAWKRTPPYVKPKKKKRAAPASNGPHYVDSSLSTLTTEIDPRDIEHIRIGEQKCKQCNLIHRGECA